MLEHDPIDVIPIDRIMLYFNNLGHRTLIKLNRFDQTVLSPKGSAAWGNF